jgi:hypothetical protein
MISRIVIAVALIACGALTASHGTTPQDVPKITTGGEPEKSTPAMVIRRGNKLGNKSPVVAVEDMVKNPKKYENKKIILEGTVKSVCQKKGCWMELISAPDRTGVRVRFKDYGFFVPKDAAGMKVRAEGKIKLTTLSKEEADHYEEEGAQLVRSADGTVREIGFVAYGVELYKLD